MLSASLQGILLVLVLGAALPRTASSRSLAQSSFTDADIFNFALNLEYLQVQVRWRYYSSVSCFEVAFVVLLHFPNTSDVAVHSCAGNQSAREQEHMQL